MHFVCKKLKSEYISNRALYQFAKKKLLKRQIINSNPSTTLHSAIGIPYSIPTLIKIPTI